MFGGIGAKVASWDEALRRAGAERAMDARSKQIAAVREDLQSRMNAQSPDYGGVGAALAERLGGAPEDYLKQLKRRGAAGEQERAGLYQQAGAAQGASPAVRLNDLLSREDWKGRTTQAGVYGGAVAGGAAGLTAAGQGLMALMEYLQQGAEVQQEREQPLS
jgi:hypothetical protein